MLNTRLTNLAANAEIDAHARLLDGGYLDIYDGPQPADAETQASGSCRLLASLQFQTPAFLGGREGVAVARELLSDPNAKCTGKATWYRLFQADHSTVVEDGSIGDDENDPSNLMINSVHIQQHVEVTVDGFKLVASKR